MLVVRKGTRGIGGANTPLDGKISSIRVFEEKP